MDPSPTPAPRTSQPPSSSQTYREYVPNYVVRENDEVRVVADDQASAPTTIRISEMLISHTNAHHVRRGFEIDATGNAQGAVHSDQGFQVSFVRTLRMPDDNRLHQLPGSLGQFDLFSVQAYVDHLPK